MGHRRQPTALGAWLALLGAVATGVAAGRVERHVERERLLLGLALDREAELGKRLIFGFHGHISFRPHARGWIAGIM